MRTFALSLILAVAMSACASTNQVEAVSDDAYADHPLSFMFGEWVGEASGIAPDRTPYTVTQTERVGPMLDGEVVVIEGKGYGDDGAAAFNAFAIVSPTGADGAWEMRSYTSGRAGTFPFEPTETGFVWSTPAGPNARMQYTATIVGDNWSQIGEYVPANGQARQMFEMNLTRIGPTDWPQADGVEISREK